MRFAYVAIDDFGKRISGSTEAESEAKLDALLRREGRHLIEARESEAAGSWEDIRVLEQVNRQDVIFFTSQLATVFGAGLDLIEGLASIEAQTEKVVLRRLIGSLRRDVESGSSLSSALARHPRYFDEVYVSVVRAGEATGHADVALRDLVSQLEWKADVRNRIAEVVTYPIIVIVLLTVLTIVLARFTIPRFIQMYESVQLDLEMPMPTRVVTAVYTFIGGNWHVLLPALAVIVIGIQLYRQTPHGSVRFSRVMLGMPVVGDLLRKLAYSRFARTFSTLHQAGVETAPALQLTEKAMGNPYMQSRFRAAVDRVLAGEPLSAALRKVGEFPSLVVQMVAIGEKTGRMDKTLKDVRTYFDQEVDREIKRTLTLATPALLLVLAGIFVMLALAFYLPLFQLSQAIS